MDNIDAEIKIIDDYFDENEYYIKYYSLKEEYKKYIDENADDIKKYIESIDQYNKILTFPKDDVWSEKDQIWKTIYILTFMVNNTNILGGIQVFKNIEDFEKNPRVYLTDRIFEIKKLLASTANENQTDEELQKHYDNVEKNIKKELGFNPLYTNDAWNCLSLLYSPSSVVYVCFRLWRLNINFFNLKPLFDCYNAKKTDATTNAKQDANQDGSSNNGSNTTGSNDGSNATTGGSDSNTGTDIKPPTTNAKTDNTGKEMSNVIIRF